MRTSTRLLALTTCIAALAALVSGFGHVETYVIEGDSAGDRLGTCVANAGDVNADMYDDVIIGAVYDDPNGADSGSARVISGKDGSTLHVFEGAAAGHGMGGSVSGTGDLNGDAREDVVVVSGGTAIVYSGLTGDVLYTLSPASSVGRAGDVNDDGWEDILVGATQDDPGRADSGTARVHSGVDGAELWKVHGSSAGDWFGFAVAGAGDVNDDGHDDIIVGAPQFEPTRTGYARLFSGADGALLRTFNGDSAGHQFGISVATAGDVNRDNHADVIVGSKYLGFQQGLGIARVFSGKDGTPLHTFTAQYESDWFGFAVAGGGDANGDGWDDVMVGAPNASRTVVYSGKDGAIIYDLNGAAGDMFGDSVAMADVNHDSFADLVVGAPWSAPNGTNSGQASIRVSDETLDDVPPTLTGVTVNEGRPYALTGEHLRLVIDADDGPLGSGVDSVKTSFDGGATWTAWATVTGGTTATIVPPWTQGRFEMPVVVRDAIGNESAPLAVTVYLLDRDPPDMGSGGKVAGAIPEAGDVDVVSLCLTAGDTLTVKLKPKSAEKGQRFELGVDLLDVFNNWIVTGRYPANASKPGIARFVVPKTDWYRIVVRAEAGTEAKTGTYKLAIKTKQAKENKSIKGEGRVTAITFEGIPGATLKGAMKGTSLDTSAMTLVGPDGMNPYDFAGSETKVKVATTDLERGWGTYEIRFPAPVTVAWKLKVKLPPKYRGKLAR